MKTVINLTPHEIKVYNQKGEIIQTFPSAGVARCKIARTEISSIGNIPINATIFGQIENLPDEQEGIVYIVSTIVAQAAKNRDDILIPDDVVRDKDGQIVGCRAFAKI